jgi:hypothetical protein
VSRQRQGTPIGTAESIKWRLHRCLPLDGTHLHALLYGFAALVEAHIDKEERLVLPLLERAAEVQMANEIERTH